MTPQPLAVYITGAPKSQVRPLLVLYRVDKFKIAVEAYSRRVEIVGTHRSVVNHGAYEACMFDIDAGERNLH
jgi:hypothetical protein